MTGKGKDPFCLPQTVGKGELVTCAQTAGNSKSRTQYYTSKREQSTPKYSCYNNGQPCLLENWIDQRTGKTGKGSSENIKSIPKLRSILYQRSATIWTDVYCGSPWNVIEWPHQTCTLCTSLLTVLSVCVHLVKIKLAQLLWDKTYCN